MTWSDFYLICFAVGFLFSLLSFVAGGLNMHGHWPHVHGLDFHSAAGHAAATHAPAGNGSAAHANPAQSLSPFNFFTIAVFLAWFGGTGYLLTRYSTIVFALGLVISTAVGLAGASIVFMRDKREKKLVPDAVSWWGWITIVSFFAVSAIPFVTTGPLAFNGVISFWIAFFTWFFWIPSLSFFIIKAIPRLKAEDEAAGRVNA